MLALMLFLAFAPLGEGAPPLTTPYSIDLEQFRWTRFPLEVLVEMNEWSLPDYAVAVREATDSWIKSIWNFTHTYNDTSLAMINYVFYVSNANATHDYDVLVAFTPNQIPPGPNTVGLTTYSWEISTHEPIPPVTINITTFSATASSLFVRNVAMHEFGHALGLGHASPDKTLNGPELMYYASSKDKVVFPSALDVYGLAELYNEGKFSQNVKLPFNIPYVMLAEGAVPPPDTNSWEDYKKYMPIVGVLFLLIVAAVVLGQLGKGEKKEETTLQPPQLPPNSLSGAKINQSPSGQGSKKRFIQRVFSARGHKPKN